MSASSSRDRHNERLDVGNSDSRAAWPITATSPGSDGPTYDGDEIEDEVFDLLVSRSIPIEPMLEIEPFEHAMLRGPRRYSVATSASARRRSSTQSYQRRPSVSSEAVAEEGVAGNRVTNEGTPLLKDVVTSTADTAASADADDERRGDNNPYLGGVTVARFWAIFLAIMASHFIACFDGTIMASSHPVITSYFGASNSASWLSTAFLLTSTTFQPLVARYSDSVGRKGPYVFTMAVFLVATVWCALAQSMTSFILARAVCGFGAGGMMALGGIIMSDLVPIEIRGTYQSYVNISYGVGSMLGAALGGAMADHLGWRWEFGVQVPFLCVCIVVSTLLIPADLGLYGTKRESLLEAMKAFDFAGSGLMSLSITFLILGLDLGGNILPWSHPFIVSSLAIFTISFPLFFYAESKATRPIMPLDLLHKSPSMNLIISNHIAAILNNAIIFNIPLYFQGVLLTSATTSGLYLIIPSLIASSTGAATGLLISRTRRLKWPLLLGSVLLLTGLVSLTNMRRSWPAAAFLLSLLPSSAGQGFQFPGSFMALLALWDQRRQAVVTSTLFLWRSLGTVLGVAGSSLVVQNALVWYLGRWVRVPGGDAAENARVVELVRGKVEAVRGLDGVVREQVVRSYEAALRLTFACCAALAVVNVLLVLPVKLPRLGKRK